MTQPDSISAVATYLPGALARGDGRRLADSHFTIKVGPDETGGGFALLEGVIPPGLLITPHVHEDVDELSIVVSGTLGAWIGDREYTVGPGGVLRKPRQVVHAMWNAGREPVVELEYFSRGDYIHFFSEIGRLPQGFGSDPDVLDELAARYHQRWVRDAQWLPQIVHKYKLGGGRPRRAESA